MQSCMLLSTGHLDGVHNLVLRSPVQTYSGFVGEADSTPICFLMSITAWLWPLGLFCFTRCITNTLSFRKKTWRLRSILEGSPFRFLNISNVFRKCQSCLCLALYGGGSEVARNFLQSFPRNMYCPSRPISLGFSNLVTGSSTIWLLF